MRISADVLVSNRALCSHNMKKPAKSAHGSLAIGKKDGEVFLMVCTPQNRGGAKYAVDKANIERVFTKFVAEGKATLRFLKPPHDVCVTKCDVVHLKAFLGVLQKAVEGRDLGDLTLSAMAPASTAQLTKAKVNLTIVHKKDYPITTSFPHTLETLTINGIALKRIDARIFKLRQLCVLDMSENNLKDVSEDIWRLPKLQELKVASNCLEDLSFLKEPKANLRLLDLSGNPLKKLSPKICDLISLSTLKLDDCQLERLPFSMDRLKRLRFLSAKKNALKTLPGPVANLFLDELDLSGNPLIENAESKVLVNNLNFPPLLDLALMACVKYSICVKDEPLPITVKRYADTYQKCPCGKLCFSAKAIINVPVQFSRFAKTYSADGIREAFFEAVVCSEKCLSKYKDNPLAL